MIWIDLREYVTLADVLLQAVVLQGIETLTFRLSSVEILTLNLDRFEGVRPVFLIATNL